LRITLPGENWAEIKEPDELTGEDEVKVRGALILTAAAGDEGKYSSDAGGPAAMEYAMLARVITSWSFPQPVNVANIRALKMSVLRPLKEAVRPHFAEIREDADPNSPGDG
jgi:hypothetical protein